MTHALFRQNRIERRRGNHGAGHLHRRQSRRAGDRRRVATRRRCTHQSLFRFFPHDHLRPDIRERHHDGAGEGATFFASETAADPQRWARFDLHDAYAKAIRNPSNVRQLLNTEDAQFEGWISGKDAIPVAAQIMMAGVLGMRLRDLFTDIPPDDAK